MNGVCPGEPHAGQSHWRLRPLAFACLLACAGAPAVQAADCAASDFATLSACAATQSTGDTITLTANLNLTANTPNIADGVTLVTNGFGISGSGTLNIMRAKILATDTSTISNSSVAFQHQFTGNGMTLAASAGKTLNVQPALLRTEISFLVFGSATDTGTVFFAPTVFDVLLNRIAIEGGTVRLGNAQFENSTMTSNGSGIVTSVAAGATLDINGFNTHIDTLGGAGTIQTGGATLSVTSQGNFSGVITGTGGVTKEGTGSLILTGNNTYTGGTTISGGVLQIGNGGTSGTLGSGNIVNNASLVFNRTDALTVTNNISGNGGVTQNGSGTLALTGNNTYTGGTTINGGTVRTAGPLGTGGNVVLNGGMLAGASSLTLSNNNLSFAAGQTSTLAAATGTTLNVGTANVTLGNNSAATFGSTGETGTIVLTAGNFNGNATATIRIAGGTLRDGNGMLGLFGTSFATSTTVDTGATLDFNGSDAVVQNLLGNGTVQTGNNSSKRLSLSNANFSGTITGASQLALGAGGVATLSGNNTYTGLTTALSGSTLQVGNGGTTGTLGNGNIANEGTLVFNRSDTLILANDISGTGNLTQSGPGTTVLTGTNSYSGLTAISAGTLHIGNGGTSGTLGSGNITNNGTLIFNRTDTLTLANDINGTGILVQSGLGTTVLTGTNGYSGLTSISAGTLQIGNGGTSGTLGSGNITNDGTLIVNRLDNLTLANAIVGSGSFTKIGGNTLVLTGANSYSGLTTISAGTLQIGNGGTAGTLGSGVVVNNGTLLFNRADALTATNAIGGTGTLTQNGTGNLILTGTNTYSGPTSVNAGTLSVNGSIISDTTVNNGGTLGGSGTTGNVIVASGGVFAPGNSIGTLTVNGDLTFNAGAIYRVETDAAGNADRVNVTGAPGTLTINGGTVDVRAGTGNYRRDTSYTILSATGGVTGNFTGVTSNLAFLVPTLSYVGNDVLLNLHATNLSYASVARTPNQLSVANYLNGFANAPGNAAALIQQIDNLSAEQARNAFDALSGNQYPATSQAASASGRTFSNSLFTHAGSAQGRETRSSAKYSTLKYASIDFSSFTTPWAEMSDTPPSAISGDTTPDHSLWVQALGGAGQSDSDGNGATLGYRSEGLVAGRDVILRSGWLAGAAFGYNRTAWNASTNGIAPASGDISTPLAALYARRDSGKWLLSVNATYADHKFDTRRTISIGNSTSTASASYKGCEYGFAMQAEYAALDPINAWHVRPLAALRHARLHEAGFTETGTSSGNLTVADRDTQNTLVSVGARVLRPFANGTSGMELRAAVSHLYGDNDTPMTAQMAGQATRFSIAGTPVKRDALTLGAGLAGKIGRDMNGHIDVSYESRGGSQNVSTLSARLTKVW